MFANIILMLCALVSASFADWCRDVCTLPSRSGECLQWSVQRMSARPGVQISPRQGWRWCEIEYSPHPRARMRGGYGYADHYGYRYGYYGARQVLFQEQVIQESQALNDARRQWERDRRLEVQMAQQAQAQSGQQAEQLEQSLLSTHSVLKRTQSNLSAERKRAIKAESQVQELEQIIFVSPQEQEVEEQ